MEQKIEENHEKKVNPSLPQETKAEEKFSSTRLGLTRAAKFLIEFLETAIIIGLIAFVIRFFLVQPFVVEGASMEPNFHNNDYLLIEKVTEHFSNPKRGDVIVFRYPNNTKVNYIKRIIGTPGDTVIIKDGKVSVMLVDSTQVETINENYLPDSLKTSGNIDIKLEKEQFFVLGDNRGNSSDSREWGVLPKNDIIGRAWLVVLPTQDFGLVPRVQYNF